MAKINYGILGCGKHALQAHALPTKETSELELVAICDISRNQLDLFEQSYGKGLLKFTDKQEFFRSGINAVLIGTPDEFHYQDLVSVIDAGLHAFVEKPLCVTSKEVNGLQTLLQSASHKGLIITSCHPRRFDSPYMWLKDNLQKYNDELGKPLEFSFDFSYHKPTKEWKHKRGLLLDHANHEIDLLHYLFGYDAFSATRLFDDFDRYHVVGKRNDGIIFNFSGTRKLESRNYFEYTTIRFEKGEMVLQSHDGIVRVNNQDTNRIDEIKISEINCASRGRLTLINFARAINNTEQCYLSHNDLYINTAMSVMLTENEKWNYHGANN